MIRPACRALPGSLLAALLLAATAPAEVVSFTGSAAVRINEFRNGSPADSVQTSDSFPGTTAELPVQVLGLLLPPIDPNDEVGDDELAAAAAAAQFADPTELDQPNPEEFAINLTLNSVSPIISYEAEAYAQEVRTVRFAPEDFLPAAESGSEVQLTGRLFLDGALAILAGSGGRDLTGANATLTVTVVQSGASSEGGTVFEGSIELRGAANGDTEVATTGGFPAATTILSDLALLNPDFGVFRVLIIPSIAIDYDYSAIVDEDTTLTATVTVNAVNLPGETGVAAVIGTPTDTLDTVIGATAGASAATKARETLTSERGAPSGDLAFPTMQPGGLCTLAGLGMLLTLTAGCIGTRPRN